MSEPVRISVSAARDEVVSGKALLVCAYDKPEKYDNYNLDGSIPYTELMNRIESMQKDQRLIFYCA